MFSTSMTHMEERVDPSHCF